MMPTMPEEMAGKLFEAQSVISSIAGRNVFLTKDATSFIGFCALLSISVPNSLMSVTTGSTVSPISANVSFHSSLALLARITSLLVFLYCFAAEEYCRDRVFIIRFCRSCSLLHSWSARLKKSSALSASSTALFHSSFCSVFSLRVTPNLSFSLAAQFSASARGPVTCPTLAVSFAASVSPSIGSEAPNCAYMPVHISVHVERFSSLLTSFERWFAASTAWSVSPRIDWSSL